MIDNQDAVFGNQAYDLASLIDDVRIETSLKFKKELLKELSDKLPQVKGRSEKLKSFLSTYCDKAKDTIGANKVQAPSGKVMR